MHRTVAQIVGLVVAALVVAGCQTDMAVTPTSEVSAEPTQAATTPAVPRALVRAPSPTHAAVRKPAVRRTAAPAVTRVKPKPTPEPVVVAAAQTDPRFDTCRAAKAAGYGPYRQGADPEYDWYTDRDHDGMVCE